MARSIRPGSLTILAILNFVGGGFALLFGVLGGAISLAMRLAADDLSLDGDAAQALIAIPIWYLAAALAYKFVTAILLIVSGVGYLRVSPWFGRWAGTAYAMLAITWSVLDYTAFFTITANDTVNLLTLAGMIYPLLTLVWLNLMLRDVWQGLRVPSGADSGPPAPPRPPSWVQLIQLHARQGLRQTLRGSSGLLFVLIVVVSGLIGVQMIGFIGGIGQQLPVDAASFSEPSARLVLTAYFQPAEAASSARTLASGGVVDATNHWFDYERWARHLLVDHASVLSFSWLLLGILIPLLVTLAGYHLVAGDAQHRGFRFLLLRTDRSSVYLGRFLAAAALVAMVMFLLVVCTVVYVHLGDHREALLPRIAWAAWAFCALTLASLPYVALAQWCSTLVNAPIGALACVNGIVLAVPALAYGMSSQYGPLWHAIHLLPLGVQPLLFHHSPWVVAGAGAACLAYTAAYLALGLRHFRRRDL